jgi:hypothetical protein
MAWKYDETQATIASQRSQMEPLQSNVDFRSLDEEDFPGICFVANNIGLKVC